VLCTLIVSGLATFAAAIPLLLINLFCRGLVAPNAQHMALEPLRENAGTAAAALGVIQILTGAGSSALVAALVPQLGPLGMTAVMAALAMASLLTWSRASNAAIPTA
jgi:DHA1 family bicyclomycin/chloramphenicol resistance-like MFS transporter